MNGMFSLWKKLSRKQYREAFPASVVKRMLPLQIRVLRKQRGWSQAQLAQASKVTQGVISRAEDPDYGNLTINTLVRIAAGFDCAFVGRFVPFSDLAKWYTSTTDEKALEVASFEDDRGFMDAHSALLLNAIRISDFDAISLANVNRSEDIVPTRLQFSDSTEFSVVVPKKGPGMAHPQHLTRDAAFLSSLAAAFALDPERDGMQFRMSAVLGAAK